MKKIYKELYFEILYNDPRDVLIASVTDDGIDYIIDEFGW